MAVHDFGRVSTLPPLALLSAALPRLSRHELEGLAEHLIDRLDEIDGDADTEDDDPAGQMDEDGINTGHAGVDSQQPPDLE